MPNITSLLNTTILHYYPVGKNSDYKSTSRHAIQCVLNKIKIKFSEFSLTSILPVPESPQSLSSLAPEVGKHLPLP